MTLVYGSLEQLGGLALFYSHVHTGYIMCTLSCAEASDGLLLATVHV